MLYANWNGDIINEKRINISPYNRSFRYGDGCFETFKMVNGKLLLHPYHFERLFFSIEQLKLKAPENFSVAYLLQAIDQLAAANHHLPNARVRLTIYREGENIKKPGDKISFIIQTMAGDGTADFFNQQGLELGIYPFAQKSCDIFSGIKSNNYLPYTMARIWANENNLDDALVYNCFGRISDSTIANIFIVENGIIKTPPLSEGCINGVMRRHLLACFRKENFPYKEEPITVEQMHNAAEVFLSNAITGMRWVSKTGKRQYSNKLAAMLYEKCIIPLFDGKTF